MSTREYYLKNRDVIRKQQAQYYLDNKGKVLEGQRAYRQRNRDTARTYQREWYERNREKILADSVMYRHGLRPEDWAAMWQVQDGRCYLCDSDLDPKHTHVDHNHACCDRRKSCPTCRRGLACSDCNAAIGYAREDPDRLRRMADALEAANAAFAQRKATAGIGDQLLLDI